MRTATALTFVLATLGHPAPASSQEEPAAEADEVADAATETDALAQRHFETGRAYFDRGRYEQALAEFQRAFELSGRTVLCYNLYLAHERLGNLAEAVDNLERYLADESVDSSTLQERLAALRERLEAEPREAPVEPEPPERVLPGDAVAVADGGGVSAPVVVSFAAAGVGVVAFGVFGGLALAEDSRLASDCGADVGAHCQPDDLSTLQGYALAADIGLGLAVAAGVLGLVLVLAEGEGDDSGVGEVALMPGLGGGSLQVGF